MALRTSSNVIVIDQLKARLQSIEAETSGDCILICCPIRFGLDVAVREALDNLSPKKRKMTVILETTGGFIEVAQRIAQTLRRWYRIVDFIIPNCAYSAGTVLAMSGDDIYMDYFSVLGPIDPQVQKDDKMVPALGYLEQYNRLVEKSNNGTLTTAELAFLINRFDPAELYMYEQAREMSISLLKRLAREIQVQKLEEDANPKDKSDKGNARCESRGNREGSQ
jgi:ClpP class serine protease